MLEFFTSKTVLRIIVGLLVPFITSLFLTSYVEKYPSTKSTGFNICILALVIFLTLLSLHYLGLSLVEPILCAEETPTPVAASGSSDTFLGLPSGLVSSTIIAFTGLAATTGASSYVAKVKMGAGGSAVGIGGLVAMDQISKNTDWPSIKNRIQNHFSPSSSPFPGPAMEDVKKSSVLSMPFEMNSNSFLHWFTETFPTFTSILLERLPDKCGENFITTYQTLFTQYNIIVLLSLIFVTTIAFNLAVDLLQSLMKKAKPYLLLHYPNSLGKFVNSTYFRYIEIATKASIIFNVLALYYAMNFLYSNPIPSNIGNITDVAIQNMGG